MAIPRKPIIISILGIRRDYTCPAWDGEDIVQTTNRQSETVFHNSPGSENCSGKLSRRLQVRVLSGVPLTGFMKTGFKCSFSEADSKTIFGGRSSVG